MTLEAALSELQAHNPTLASTQYRTAQAEAVVRQAQAALYPTATLQGSYIRNSADAEINMGEALPPALAANAPGRIVIQPLDQWTGSAALRVPLLVPNAWYDVQAAKAAARAQTVQKKVADLQLKTALAQFAYGAMALEEVLQASDRAIQLTVEQAESAKRRVQAGTAAPLDVLRADTERVRRESDRARARAELERVHFAMGILMGRAGAVCVKVPELLDVREGSAGQVPTETALNARPELAVLKAQADAAHAQIRSARARLLPQLSATASAFASDVPYPTGDKSGWRLSVDLTIPLYDGGYRYGKKREAEAALGAAESAATEQRLKVVQELEDARRDIRLAHEQRRLADTQQQLAKDAAESAQRGYDAGILTSLDVLDANDRQYRADVAVAEARARLAQAILALEKAMGSAPGASR